MFVFLDEAGDLGFKFDAPYMRGGSSRFLTLTCLFVPKNKKHFPKRVIKSLYSKFRWSSSEEVKSSEMTKNQKICFCNLALSLFQNNKDIQVHAITVKKENVQRHIQADGNILYNYMTNLCAMDEIKKHASVTLYPDKKSIKVKSGNSLTEYLKTKLWFEHNVSTQLEVSPADSSQSRNIQFVDILCNCIWRQYEYRDPTFIKMLSNHLNLKPLFF